LTVVIELRLPTGIQPSRAATRNNHSQRTIVNSAKTVDGRQWCRNPDGRDTRNGLP
jgi:hypothetical protein